MTAANTKRRLLVLITVTVLGMLYSLAKVWLAHRLAAAHVPAGMDPISWSKGAFTHGSISATWSLVLCALGLVLSALCYRLGRASY